MTTIVAFLRALAEMARPYGGIAELWEPRKKWVAGKSDEKPPTSRLPSDQIKGVRTQDDKLEITIETDIMTVGTLVLRVGTLVEYVQWMAALHDKWMHEGEERGKLVAP